jgi:hypothetical protein
MTNGENSWGVGWPAISFFERVLSNHTAVESYTRANDIQFKIIRRGDHPDVNAILVEDYMLGEATVYEVLEEFPDVNAIVNNGTWNHIALNWRDFAKRTGVVVLEMADFLGSLNVKELAKYIPRDEREEHRRKRRLSS